MATKPRFTIVGGGLGGALLACYLGRAGHAVDVYELRGDMRVAGYSGGRSINLAISHRGLAALDGVGLKDDILSIAVPMRGRMIHAPNGETAYQPYGKDDSQCIYSVSRGELNIMLLKAASRYDAVRMHFHEKCTGVELESGTAHFVHMQSGAVTTSVGGIVLSADGAFSAVRRSMQKVDRFDFSQQYLEHGYKELFMPAGAHGAFSMEKHALHIWPRRSYMMIALPNNDGSFTCTCFWPMEGTPSFAALTNEAEVERFFGEHFPDAVPLMPTLAKDYLANPVGTLVTIRCAPWQLGGRVLLLGDAAHAIVPFYGQGANAAFEDVLVFDECMRNHKGDWTSTFARFEQLRRHNTDVLADLAIHNFIEMRDHTGSRKFRYKKKAEKWLQKMLPNWYVPLYTMVSFTRTPYAEAVAKARNQTSVVLMVVSTIGLMVLAAILAVAARLVG